MTRQMLRLGVSACLLGERVRWDGGHKRAGFLVEALRDVAEWVPVCPEMAVGMGTPREPVRLVEGRGGVRMVGETSGRDWTETMTSWARAHFVELERARLHGFVLKSNSPSCGLSGVKLYPARGGPATASASGLFAEALVARFARLPVEDETRLGDPSLLAAFLDRASAYRDSVA